MTTSASNNAVKNAIAMIESSGNPEAVGPTVLVGANKGDNALGLYQAMPITMRDPGFGITPARDLSFEEANRVGSEYIDAMLARYGDEDAAAVAHFAGPGNADKWIASGKDYSVLPQPAATQEYISKFRNQLQSGSGGSTPTRTPARMDPALKEEVEPPEEESTAISAGMMLANDILSNSKGTVFDDPSALILLDELPDDFSPISPNSLSETFARGVNAGFGTINAEGHRMMAAFDAIVGNDQGVADRFKAAESDEAKAPVTSQTFQAFLENPTFGGFLEQAIGATGQATPSIALSVIGAVVTGGTASVAGIVGPQVAKKAGTAVIKDIVKDAVSKRVRGEALDEAEDVIVKAGYNKMRQAIARSQGSMGRNFRRGAIVGAFGAEYPYMAGGAVGEVEASGEELTPGRAFTSLGIGVPLALTGVAGEALIVKSFIKQARKKAAQNINSPFARFANTLAKSTALGSGVEGGTEAIQESGQVAWRYALDEDYDSVEASLRIAESTFSGLVAGGTFGATGGSVTGTVQALRGNPTDRMAPPTDVPQLDNPDGNAGISVANSLARALVNAGKFVDRAGLARVEAWLTNDKYGVNDRQSDGRPTGEPLSDIDAQLTDMLDEGVPRRGMLITEGTPEYTNMLDRAQVQPGELKTGVELAEGVPEVVIANIPGKGLLVTTDVDTAQEALGLAGLPEFEGFLSRMMTGLNVPKTGNETHVVYAEDVETGGRAVEIAVTQDQIDEVLASTRVGRDSAVEVGVETIEESLEKRRQRLNSERDMILDTAEFSAQAELNRGQASQLTEQTADNQVGDEEIGAWKHPTLQRDGEGNVTRDPRNKDFNERFNRMLSGFPEGDRQSYELLRQFASDSLVNSMISQMESNAEAARKGDPTFSFRLESFIDESGTPRIRGIRTPNRELTKTDQEVLALRERMVKVAKKNVKPEQRKEQAHVLKTTEGQTYYPNFSTLIGMGVKMNATDGQSVVGEGLTQLQKNSQGMFRILEELENEGFSMRAAEWVAAEGNQTSFDPAKRYPAFWKQVIRKDYGKKYTFEQLYRAKQPTPLDQEVGAQDRFDGDTESAIETSTEVAKRTGAYEGEQRDRSAARETRDRQRKLSQKGKRPEAHAVDTEGSIQDEVLREEYAKAKTPAQRKKVAEKAARAGEEPDRLRQKRKQKQISKRAAEKKAGVPKHERTPVSDLGLKKQPDQTDPAGGQGDKQVGPAPGGKVTISSSDNAVKSTDPDIKDDGTITSKVRKGIQEQARKEGKRDKRVEPAQSGLPVGNQIAKYDTGYNDRPAGVTASRIVDETFPGNKLGTGMGNDRSAQLAAEKLARNDKRKPLVYQATTAGYFATYGFDKMQTFSRLWNLAKKGLVFRKPIVIFSAKHIRDNMRALTSTGGMFENNAAWVKSIRDEFESKSGRKGVMAPTSVADIIIINDITMPEGLDAAGAEAYLGTIAAHEIGHIVFNNNIDFLAYGLDDGELKRMFKRDYASWDEATQAKFDRSPDKGFQSWAKKQQAKHKSIRDDLWQAYLRHIATLSKAQREEQMFGERRGFEEWFADQIAAVALNEAVDVKGEAKGFIKQIADFLKNFWDKMVLLFKGRAVTDLDPTFKEFMERLYFSNAGRTKTVSSKYSPASLPAVDKFAIRDLIDDAADAGPVRRGELDSINERTQDMLKGSTSFPEWLKRTFYAAEDYFRSLGTGGKTLARFFYARSQSKEQGAFHTAKTDSQNRLVEQLRVAMGITNRSLKEKDFTSPEMTEAFRLASDERVATADLPQQAKRIRRFFERVYDNYLTIPGTKRQWFPINRRKNYAPRTLDVNRIERNQAAFLRFLQQYMDAASAADVMSKILEGDTENDPIGKPTVGSSFQRTLLSVPTLDLIDAKWALDPYQSTLEYIHQITKRVEFEKRTREMQTGVADSDKLAGADFMRKLAIEAAEGDYEVFAETLKTELSSAAAMVGGVENLTPEDFRGVETRAAEAAGANMPVYFRTNQGIAAQFGRLNTFNGVDITDQNSKFATISRNVNSVAATHTVVTTLMFAVLASLPDLGGIAMRGKEWTNLKNMYRYIRDKEGRAETDALSRSIGARTNEAVSDMIVGQGELDHTTPWAKKITNLFFNITGTNWYTNYVRRLAAGMGRDFLVHNARHPDFDTDPRRQRYLDELGVTREQVIAWDDAGQPLEGAEFDAVKNALSRFVYESIVRPSAAQRPIWASNPWFLMLWTLKSYFYAYGKAIVGGAGREIANRFGEAGLSGAGQFALIGAATVLPLTMFGLAAREQTKWWLRWAIPGLEADGTVFQSRYMDTDEYMFEILDRSGTLGPATLLTSTYQGMAREGILFGPAISNIPALDAVDDSFFDGDAARLVPFVNNL